MLQGLYADKSGLKSSGWRMVVFRRAARHRYEKELAQRRAAEEQARWMAEEQARQAQDEHARQQEQVRRRAEKEQARRKAEDEQAKRRAEDERARQERERHQSESGRNTVSDIIQRSFSMFELSYSARFEDVKKKRQIMIKLFYPDKHSTDDVVCDYANKRMQEINEAFLF